LKTQLIYSCGSSRVPQLPDEIVEVAGFAATDLPSIRHGAVNHFDYGFESM
jgi:hypothetical protein